MRLLYIVFCAVSLARLPVQAATIAQMLPLDMLAGNPVSSRQIHSADFSSNIPSSTSIDVQEVSIPESPQTSLSAKAGHRNSAKFAKRDTEMPPSPSFLSSSISGSKAFYNSHLSGEPDSKSLIALKRSTVNNVVEKMLLPARDVSLPSGVNSHTIDPKNIPSYVGLKTPPDRVQSVIEQQHALSKMVSRGIELPAIIRPHPINFAARSDGDAGNEDSEDENENENSDDNSGEDSEEDAGLDNDDDGSDDKEEADEEDSEDPDNCKGDDDDSEEER